MADEDKKDADSSDSEAPDEEETPAGSEASPEASGPTAEELPEFPRWAADEPTAMWDESSMRDEGYSALAEDRQVNPRAQAAPATGRDVGGADDSRVRVSSDATGGHKAVSGPPKGGGGVSWVVTIAIAVGLAVAVFLLVRFLR